MSITYLAGGGILDQQFGSVSPTVPANYFVGLSTTTILEDGTGYTEPVGINGYARVQIANNKTTWSNSAANSVTNLIEVAFPESTGDWGTITYVFLSDSGVVGGDSVHYFGVLTPNRAIQTGTIVYFTPGDIIVTIANI
jgi:hypothetical protein